MENWNGKERRMSNDDHDLLTRIDANLNNFLREFKQHTELDDVRIAKVEKDNEFQNRVIWMGLGGIAILQVAIHLIK